MFTPKNRDESGAFIKVPAAMRRYNMCREKTVQLAREAEAYIRYGNVVLINTKRCDDFLVGQYTE